MGIKTKKAMLSLLADVIEFVIYLAIALVMFWCVVFSGSGCSNKTPPPPPPPRRQGADQPRHPPSGFVIDGIVKKRYVLNGEYLVKIENFDGRIIVVHSKKFYDKYKEGDRVRLNGTFPNPK